jgi:predicted DNA-binding protein YlxM (UPF0122 family)
MFLLPILNWLTTKGNNYISSFYNNTITPTDTANTTVVINDKLLHDQINRMEEFCIKIDKKLNLLEANEKKKIFLRNRHERIVRLPHDTSKHPRLAVYSESVDENTTKIAFVTGQTQNFRKRKLPFDEDDNMELVFDEVHGNPLLAIQCINEHFNNNNYNVQKRAKRMLQVDCEMDTAKKIVSQVLNNKIDIDVYTYVLFYLFTSV